MMHHQHQMILVEDDEENKRPNTWCNNCRLPISSNQFYRCGECSFFKLHKFCMEIPSEIQHPCHPNHPLILKVKGLHTPERIKCFRCEDTLTDMQTYSCPKCPLFVIDIVCACLPRFGIEHGSHPQHPLIPLSEEALFLCQACGTKHQGRPLSCTSCWFWIDRNCAQLPTTFEAEEYHPQHPLQLAYSLPNSFFPESSDDHDSLRCEICGQPINCKFWVYYCGNCRYLAHVRCATSTTEPFMSIFNSAARSLEVNYHDIDPVHLPVESEVVTLVRHFLEGNKSWQLQETSKNPICNHHGHPMILNEYMTEQDGSPNVKRNMEPYSSLCNGCIQPISPPFYSCIDMKCDFLLHKSCYEVPFQVHAREDLLLGGQDLENVLGIFHCDVCCRPCNGLKYFRRSNGNRVLDVKCALAPKYIIHESHPEHRLKLSKRKYGPCPACLLTGENQGGYIYRCLTCSFNLHQKCALYPSTVSHKYDKHPLKLTYKPIKGHLSDEYYCEICELELNQHGWFYHCIECEQYFHITCIPAVDDLSNIKFGATLKLDNHAHPLTFTRIILERPCGYCKESIKDGMAFQCMECKKYHIHFQCAKTCAPAQGDQPFPTGLVDGVNGHLVLTLTQTQDKSGAITGSWADHGDPPDVPIPVVNLPPEGGRDDISGSLSGSWDRGRILSVPKDLVDEQIALTLGRPRTRSGSKYSTSLDGGNLQIPTEPLKIGGDVALKPGGDKRGSISGRGAIRYFPEKRDVRAAGRDRLGGFEAYPMSEYVPPCIPMKRVVLTHDQLELYDRFDASSYSDRRNKYIPTIGFRRSSTGRSSAHSEIKTFVDMNRSSVEELMYGPTRYGPLKYTYKEG